MPTATEVAPARINSAASAPLMTPPTPTIGSLTALWTSHTMRTAMGCRAGPDMPPVGLDSLLLRVRTSMAMPGMELMTVRMSAPSASSARATSTTRAGAIFTSSGRLVRPRTARMTSAAPSGVDPMAQPPAAMLGQLMLISRPAAKGASSSKSSTAATYSSTEWPATWQITAVPLSESCWRYSPELATRPRTPGFCRPTEFMTPEQISVMRGAGFPCQGSAAQPLVVMAPSWLTS